MDEIYKEVYFDQYCEHCKHKKKDDMEEPCDACLDHAVNVDSHKPVYFEEMSKREARTK